MNTARAMLMVLVAILLAAGCAREESLRIGDIPDRSSYRICKARL